MLLPSVTPTSTGCIPLASENGKAVAIWWSKGARSAHAQGGRVFLHSAGAAALGENSCKAIASCSHVSFSPSLPLALFRDSSGNDVSLLQAALNGGLAYMWRYSGWTRRGRFLGYSEVIREVRRRIMRSHGDDYFYLLTYAHHPALSDADAAAQLAAVVKPVTDRVRSHRKPGAAHDARLARGYWLPPQARRLTAACPRPAAPRRSPPAPAADALAQPCYLELTNLVHVAMFEVRALAPIAQAAATAGRATDRALAPSLPRRRSVLPAWKAKASPSLTSRASSLWCGRLRRSSRRGRGLQGPV